MTKPSSNLPEEQDPERGTLRKTVYNRHIARAKNVNNYFIFCRCYYKILKSRLAALFLQDLMNLASSPMVTSQEINGDDYFLCTTEFLKDSISEWTQDEQRRYLKELRSHEFIKTARHGVLGPRWISIDYLKIEEAIDESENSQIGGKPPIKIGGKPPIKIGGKPPINKNTTYSKNKRRQKNRAHPFEPPDKVNGFGVEGDNVKAVHSDHAWAVDLLKDSLKNNGRRITKWSRSKWADTFQLLKEKDGIDYRVTLETYCRHCNRKDQDLYGMPFIRNAYEFRQHYEWIDSKVKLILKAEQEDIPVVISRKAHQVLDRLSNLHWPRGRSGLDVAIQKSLTNFKDYQTHLSALKERLDQCQGSDQVYLRRFLKHFEDTLFRYPGDGVEEWFRKVHASRANWQDWDGDFSKEVFSLTSKRFRRILLDLAMEWSPVNGESCVNAFLQSL
ncbi:MAG: hypothetical protein KGL39_00835 [Patescibacteria group bacterium]|nr:hypothetical protein [Patescibacteria group bacterium]